MPILYQAKSPACLGGTPALLSMVLLIAAAGCGDGSESTTGGSGDGPPELAVVHGAPASSDKEPEQKSYFIEGYATAMASNGAFVAVGTTTSVYTTTTSGLTLLAIGGDEPQLPPATGSVRAMAAYDDGLLIAAESALFWSAGGVLQLSPGNDALHPLGIKAMTARVADDDGDAVSETHLVLSAEGGAYELEGSGFVKWTVEGESGAPTAMLGQKDRLFLAFGRRVYEIDRPTKAAYPLVFDIGDVREIACSSRACDEGSLVYFASDAGLVQRSPDGAYTLYPLAAEGEPAVPVETFALDASKQRLYALAGSSVLRIRDGELPDAVATVGAASGSRHMAVDKLGDVWTGEGLTVRALALGTPLSFTTDVKPIMHEYCAECHSNASNGAPKIDFESYEALDAIIEVALMRVAEGTMPPPSYKKKLPKEKIQILQDWAATKAP